MKSSLIAVPLSACLMCAALFPLGALPSAAAADDHNVLIEQDLAAPALAEPPADAAGCLLAVQGAWDPATAEDAYQRGLKAGADPVAINQSYVREMINLGLPGQAEEAAEQIVDVFPQDGVAWAVLAYADAARNDTTAALAEMAMAVDWAPDDPFVLGVAGKLMAWYRFPGLGDPSELPDGLPERLDEIHAQLSTLEAYRIAFDAAYAFYESQASTPIADYPQEIVEPAFEEIPYTPAICPTYNEYVYSGFTVPCFSVSWLVPRVRCYVIHDRPVWRHLRFHIGDRCDRYHSRFHARRLNWDRIRRCVAYHVAGRIRLGWRAGLHLPPVRARYTRAMFSSRHADTPFRRTDPPPASPKRVVKLLSSRLGGSQLSHASRTAPEVAHRVRSEIDRPGSARQGQPRITSPSGRLRSSRHQRARTRSSDPKSGPRIGVRTDASPHVRSEPQPKRRTDASSPPQQAGHSRRSRPDPKPQFIHKTAPEKGPQRRPALGERPTSTGKTEPRPNPKPQAAPASKPQTGRRSMPQARHQPHAAPSRPNPQPHAKAEPERQPTVRSHRTSASREANRRASSPETGTRARPPSARAGKQDARPTRPSSARPTLSKARPHSPPSASAGRSRKAPPNPQLGQPRKSGRK
jgi:hypothetical protein